MWRYSEGILAQFVQLIVSIILARILSPEDYGMVGLIAAFISIPMVLIQSGFTQALIQKKTTDQLDFSSVFYFSLSAAAVLYLILFISAPFVARFYGISKLSSIIRILSLTLFIGAINSVQQSFVSKKKLFQRFFWATLGGTSVSAIVSIMMAYNGYGVWALVSQQITGLLINTIILWFTVKWRPKLIFSISRLKNLFKFSGNIVCSNLINAVYNNLYSLTIGKLYSPAELGFYNRGNQFPCLISENLNKSMESVMFVVMSEHQEDKERVKDMVRRSIVTSTFVIFPAMAGLAVTAEPLILLILQEKWLPCVPFLRYCCFICVLWPIHTTNLQAIKALGQGRVFLRRELIEKVIGTLIFIATIPFGIQSMMLGRCIFSLLALFINTLPNKKLISYSLREQLHDITPSILLSVGMALIVAAASFLQIDIKIKLILQFMIGFSIYFLGAKLMKHECLEYLILTLRGLLSREK